MTSELIFVIFLVILVVVLGTVGILAITGVFKVGSSDNERRSKDYLAPNPTTSGFTSRRRY